MPAAGCHELVGQRKGEFAIPVSNNYRLIFKPYHDPVIRKSDGGIDWTKVSSIQIIGIEDYH
jgi:proteic killer suppression protein